VLPSSSDARAEAPESALGMVRLVEVVLKPGKRSAHPLQRLAFQERTLNPGYAGAEAPGISTTRRDSGESNHVKSAIMACVEHVFGFMTTSMGGNLTRIIWLEKTGAWCGLKNLSFNFFRYLQRSCSISTLA
jgi:hypothetical protein